ncbi:late embryogeneis abundant protein [Capsicum galapagoense]
MKEAGHKNSRRNLKICCGVTLLLSIILIIVSITLFHTVLKPKKPQITLHPISLDEIESQIFSRLSSNVTLRLRLIITIKNPNYGSFKYKDSIASLIYHGNNSVGEIVIERGTVPSKGELNINSYANIIGEKIITSTYFVKDIEAGSLNMTSNLTLHGKVKLLKVFKIHATVTSHCDISVLVHSLAIKLRCHSKVRL